LSNLKIIGFDRFIKLEWLDATAEWVDQGLSDKDLRSTLNEYLMSQISGKEARKKTITVLTHIWLNIPEKLVYLRDEGLQLRKSFLNSNKNSLPIHWGMCLATYPFFRIVAENTGRLLNLQNSLTAVQIKRRMKETWGDRSKVERSTRHIIQCFVDWNVLEKSDRQAVYISIKKNTIDNDNLLLDPSESKQNLPSWLCETFLVSHDSAMISLSNLANNMAFFPFKLKVTAGELAQNPRLEILQQGLDDEYVRCNM